MTRVLKVVAVQKARTGRGRNAAKTPRVPSVVAVSWGVLVPKLTGEADAVQLKGLLELSLLTGPVPAIVVASP